MVIIAVAKEGHTYQQQLSRRVSLLKYHYLGQYHSNGLSRKNGKAGAFVQLLYLSKIGDAAIERRINVGRTVRGRQ